MVAGIGVGTGIDCKSAWEMLLSDENVLKLIYGDQFCKSKTDLQNLVNLLKLIELYA